MKKNTDIKIENYLTDTDNIENVEWNGIKIYIKKTLSLKEQLQFVSFVTEASFDENGEYRPEMRSFAMFTQVIDQYTNIPIGDDVENLYRFIYETDIIDIIYDHINISQYEDIRLAILDKINNISSANVEAVNFQVKAALQSLSEELEHLPTLFENISKEDLEKLFGAIQHVIDVDDVNDDDNKK